MSMRNVRDIPVLHDIPVLVRAATNVPLTAGKVASAFRLSHTIPTIEHLVSRGAKVIVIGHIGRSDTETLRPVYEELRQLIPRLSFCEEAVGPRAREAARALHPGDVLLLENLRRYRGEEANDPGFASELASLADVFVQDSFDAAHRFHASIVGVPKILPSYAGLLFEKEIRELTRALMPMSPSLAVVSGVKFETKAPVLKKLLSLYDQVFVGGAIGNDLLKAKGYVVGASLTSRTDTSFVAPVLHSEKLLLPRDAVVTTEEGGSRTMSIHDLRPEESIVDIGPETISLLAKATKEARSILWNGPLGVFEKGFRAGTDSFARLAAASGAHSIVGGGDTVLAIEEAGLEDQFSFLSTGGGAMLEFFAKGTLPGIDALG